MGMGRIAASGMNAAMEEMDVISNNIANQDTIGFKQSSIQFSDLYPSSSNTVNQPGMGVDVSAITQDFTAGSYGDGTAATNMAIKGSGFFMLQNPNTGQLVYTRNGAFTFNSSLSNYLTFGSQNVQGFQAVNGIIPSGASATSLLINTSSVPAVATTALTPQTSLNLSPLDTPPTNTTFNPANSDSYTATTSATVYDSLGVPTPVTMYYVKAQAPTENTWTMYAVVNGNVINQSSPTTMTFAPGTGVLTAPTTPVSLSYSPTTGATSPQTFTVDYTGTTQTGSKDTIGTFTPNGSLPGAFSGVTVDGDGNVFAQYTNGSNVLQGQVALANFSNPGALNYLGGSQWTATTDAGTPAISPTNSRNNIVGGSLEASNVNVTQQLVNLIGAQNAFQANAQAEQTYNQVMQVVTKL